MALSDFYGYRRLRLGSSDDLEQIRDEGEEDVRVLATFPGAEGLATRVHVRLFGTARTTESTLLWYDVSLPTVLRAIAQVVEELQT